MAGEHDPEAARVWIIYAQNGYVLYFSDRRGMLYNPHPPLGGAAAKAGDSGLEDVINAASAGHTRRSAGNSGRAILPRTSIRTDFWTTSARRTWDWASLERQLPEPEYRSSTPRPTPIPSVPRREAPGSRVAAHRAQELGQRGAPRFAAGGWFARQRTAANGRRCNLDSPGGFTVASENPVYILGDYNSNTADSAGWAGDTPRSRAISPDTRPPR